MYLLVLVYYINLYVIFIFNRESIVSISKLLLSYYMDMYCYLCYLTW